MMHSFIPDFLVAARIGAAQAAEALKWEDARRVHERVEKNKEESQRTSDQAQAVLTTMLVFGVPSQEIQAIERRIGYHQEAVIEALQENREQLDQAEEHLDHLLSKAHVLEDGRRVFETEDGTRVNDEFGRQLRQADISPDDIDNARPKWESYDQARTERDRLVELQTELIEYQDRLDEAQVRLQDGDLTREELSDLNDLLADAPTAVRSRLPQGDPNRTQPTHNFEQGPEFGGTEVGFPKAVERRP